MNKKTGAAHRPRTQKHQAPPIAGADKIPIAPEKFIDGISLDVWSYGSIYPTRDGLDYLDYETYLNPFQCKITGWSERYENGVSIGKIRGSKARLSQAYYESGVSPAELLDQDGEAAQYYELLGRGDDKDELLLTKKAGEIAAFDFCHTLIMFDRGQIWPRFRGQDLGLLALYYLMQMLTDGDIGILFALKPFPLQYINKETDENRSEIERDRRKLAKYWERLGFEKATPELWIVGNSNVRPKPEQFMRYFVQANPQEPADLAVTQ